MALTNQPYFPMYVDDYIGDERLNQCDPASQGMYIRLMCIMHKSSDYGRIEITPFDKAKFKQNASKTQANQEQKEMIAYLSLNYDDFLAISHKVKAIILWDISVIFSALLDLIGNNVVQFDGNILSQKRMVADGLKSKARADAGSIGGSANNDKKSKTQAKPKAKRKQKPVIGSVIDNEGVIDSGNDDENIKDLSKSEIETEVQFPFDSHDFLNMWHHWKDYKEKEFRFKYKSHESEQSALMKLAELSNGDEKSAIAILKQSMGNGWKGFFELKTTTNASSKNGKEPTGREVNTASALNKIDSLYRPDRNRGNTL